MIVMYLYNNNIFAELLKYLKQTTITTYSIFLCILHLDILGTHKYLKNLRVKNFQREIIPQIDIKSIIDMMILTLIKGRFSLGLF